MAGLTRGELMKVVNRYIGVSNGYLGDFNYNSHSDFYSEYCDLDINPFDYPGTTRERFIAILNASDPRTQAKILRGVLERFPVDVGPTTRTSQLREELLAIADRLDSTGAVISPTPAVTSQAVERALADADSLILARGYTSAVDRVHTALHGYLMALCDESGITYVRDAKTTVLFKLLRDTHPRLAVSGPRSGDILSIQRALATIVDVFNPIRNQATGAHPNPELLDEAEATLVVNAARTMFHYLDLKLR